MFKIFDLVFQLNLICQSSSSYVGTNRVPQQIMFEFSKDAFCKEKNNDILLF